MGQVKVESCLSEEQAGIQGFFPPQALVGLYMS